MYDICVIGCGRVGLPLALSLREKKLNVCGVDINDEMIEGIKNNKMPFYEPGYDELVKETFTIYNSKYENYPDAKAYILTVGTPLGEHIETDLSQVTFVINDLISKIDIKNKLIILRSTVAPNTTEYIKNIIENKTNYILGKDFYLAMCPERIVEGEAYKELLELPQVIGTEDEKSFDLAKNIFSILGIQIFKSTFIEAELSKLFTNIYRYINMAIPNYFSYMSQSFGVDIYKLFSLMNPGYDRNKGLLTPGFAKGTCLTKDWGMINENFPQTDLILQAYKINEFTPKFYVDLIQNDIKNKTIGIFGFTFKSNTDDTRDNLTPKLIRYLERNLPEQIKINEPNLPLGEYNDKYNNMIFINYSIEEVKQCDIIIIAINHKEYLTFTKEEFNDKIVIDGWNILKENLYNNWRN